MKTIQNQRDHSTKLIEQMKTVNKDLKWLCTLQNESRKSRVRQYIGNTETAGFVKSAKIYKFFPSDK